MLTRLWQENKRFLLIAGSGLAVFLLINSFLGGFQARVSAVSRKSSALAQECRKLLQDVKPLGDERKRLEELRAHEVQLLQEIVLPPEPELAKFNKGSPVIQFNEAIDRAWGIARDRANQLGAVVPEKLGPNDFGAEKQHEIEDYKGHYAHLAIARRALVALVDAGMTEIGRPEIEDEELSEVLKDDPSVELRYRSVRFRVAGPYESYIKVLKGVQGSESFLQVSIATLGMKGVTDERTVKGDLRFTGLELVEGAEAAKPGGERAKPARARRRR